MHTIFPSSSWRQEMHAGKQVSPEDVESVRQRQRICDLVMKGDVEGALSAADAVAPGALAGLHTLAFRLHLQAFIEHVSLPLRPPAPPQPTPSPFTVRWSGFLCLRDSVLLSRSSVPNVADVVGG